jgi:hypothetical protein
MHSLCHTHTTRGCLLSLFVWCVQAAKLAEKEAKKAKAAAKAAAAAAAANTGGAASEKKAKAKAEAEAKKVGKGGCSQP